MRTAVCLVAAAALLACSDNPFEATVENVSGDYTATTFTSTDVTGTTNHLAAGATLTLSLESNGTTSGHLFVPGGDEGGGDLNADLSGTWALSGNNVEFTQTADTFIRNVVFTAAANRLSAQATFSGTTIRVVLIK